MTTTDADIAGAILDAYAGKTGAWLAPVVSIAGVRVGVDRRPDCDLVIFPGSETAEDWARDFFAVPHTIIDHPGLGPLHAGFALGLDKVWAALAPVLGAAVKIGGHSLGAARGLITAGELILAGRAPMGVTAFGSPRPGFQRLADVLAPAPIRSYRNGDLHGHDVVTNVPFHVPEIAPFVHPHLPLIGVTAMPTGDDAWSPFALHHMPLYALGVGLTP